MAPLSTIQLNAVALSGPPVAVPLSEAYNVLGISTSHTSFGEGFDHSGANFAAEALTPRIRWRGVTFPLGNPNAPNVVTSTTVPLPQGTYGKLLLLGDLVNDVEPATVPFIIHYTDGTSMTVTQSLSDWVTPKNYPGESIVACAPFRYYPGGFPDANSVCIYGYDLSLDPTKVVESVTLPDNRDILVLAMALLPPAVPGDFTYYPAAGFTPPIGQNTLQAVFTPADRASFGTATATVPLSVTAPPIPFIPEITWPAPNPLGPGTPLSSIQLNASASEAVLPVAVPLNTVYRTNAIYSDGSLYRETGLDYSEQAFSAESLGKSLSYAGTTFPLGPPSVPNAATSSSIDLPAGSFSKLQLLGVSASTAAQTAQTFTVRYTDGTSTSANLDLSSWVSPQHFPGETIVATTNVRNLSTGEQMTGPADIYGYEFALDPSRTVATLILPNNINVLVFAVAVQSDTSIEVPGRFVYAPPAGTVLPLGQHPLSTTFTPSDTRYFSTASATNSIEVRSRVLDITAHDATRLYGTTNPAFTGSITGAVEGDIFTETFATPATVLSPAGTYPIVPRTTGPNLSTYKQQIHPGALTVTKAPALISLAGVPASILQSASFEAKADVMSSTSGTPTGTVTFYQNGAVFSVVSLANGSATTSLQMSTVAPIKVSASYSGDTNFLSASADAPSISVIPLDFIMTAPKGNALTATIGQDPSLPIHLEPKSIMYSADVTLSTAGTLPLGTTITFSPSSVGMHAGPTDVVMTVNTLKLAGNEHGPITNPCNPWMVTALLIIFPAARLRRFAANKQLRLLSVVGFALLSGLTTLSITGCGTGYAEKYYNFTVTATSGTVAHTIPMTLHILKSPQ